MQEVALAVVQRNATLIGGSSSTVHLQYSAEICLRNVVGIDAVSLFTVWKPFSELLWLLDRKYSSSLSFHSLSWLRSSHGSRKSHSAAVTLFVCSGRPGIAFQASSPSAFFLCAVRLCYGIYYSAVWYRVGYGVACSVWTLVCTAAAGLYLPELQAFSLTMSCSWESLFSGSC